MATGAYRQTSEKCQSLGVQTMYMHACMTGITWACVFGAQTATERVLKSFLGKHAVLQQVRRLEKEQQDNEIFLWHVIIWNGFEIRPGYHEKKEKDNK